MWVLHSSSHIIMLSGEKLDSGQKGCSLLARSCIPVVRGDFVSVEAFGASSTLLDPSSPHDPLRAIAPGSGE